MNILSEKKEMLFQMFRQFLYFVFILGFVFFLHFLARIYGNQTFEEHGIVENLQFLFLGFAGFMFFAESLFFNKQRIILFFFNDVMFVCLLSGIRQVF